MSGGIITNLHPDIQPVVTDLLDSADHDYVAKLAIPQARLVVAFVYCLPFKSLNVGFTDPNRWRIIKSTLSTLSRIIRMAEHVGYDFMLLGDENARLGALTGDHLHGPPATSLWEPFIEAHDLHLLNIDPEIAQHRPCKGKYTCFPSTGGKSIVDLAFVNNSFSNRAASLSFTVINNLHNSDHRPIMIKVSRPLYVTPETPRKLIWQPCYRIRTHLDDPAKNAELVRSFRAAVRSSRQFLDELRLGRAEQMKRLPLDARRRHIDNLWNFSTGRCRRAC